ncbi:hypothetical protein HS1genome_1212 [Sulfodiicoccus acidiphilus]|uniref:Polysaccharide biosynthesis protein n=1 Tax=Sulfodiicoccus acidiphilus TaxID=1670455 RepID=A0A348B3S1_9CREN|nr:hypothetical protein HS1genome_1212 [Sulfodiicoccus acidiphilus]GGU04205.1 hypothetical protein GCM10007116_21130 [Sulfodiicoccus acidiphilus]
MGGVVLMNVALAAISSILFFALSPIFVAQTKYVQGTIFFYISPILIILTYLLKVTSSIAIGKTPAVYGVSTVLFQVARLAFAVVAMYVLNLSVAGVILAYSVGYIIQTLVNLRYVKANLKVDMNIALAALKKSFVFVVSKLQGLAEATIIIIAVAYTGSAVVNSYFESAIIVSNIANWAASLPSGVIAELKDEPKAYVVESSAKIFVVSSMLLMALIIAEAKPLLHLIRPDYVGALLATYVIAASNLLRSFANLFYYAVGMRDETLAVEGGNSFKGPMGTMVRNNVLFSAIGVAVSVTLGYLFRTSPYSVEVALLSIGPAINSVYMIYNSVSKSRQLYSFPFPWRETLVSTVGAIIAGIPFTLIPILHISQMIVTGLGVVGIYAILTYLLSPYVRRLVSRGLGLVFEAISRARPEDTP